jgi:hypothetical protein
MAVEGNDPAFWADRRAQIEATARVAGA